MSLHIYNTQTKRKEEFKPLVPGEVRMYVCGPTVYDFLHVGNFRGPIFFNLVRNYLESLSYKVKYVYNYTDVDDKIIARAKELNIDAQKVAETYIKEFEHDYQTLKLRPHTANPRVTEFMGQIISFIEELVKAGKAYVVDGDVYFSVKDFADYGKLSHKQLEDLESGYRIEVDERKRHPADFALWKSAKPGEPSWPSPWGEGRPGWHIECSTMARTLLGDTIDIHGGGMDLVFPHHENEIAQSEGCTGKPFVRYWMHNNMLEFGQQKMSKSLGNIKKAREFLQEYNAEILKYMMLSSHYRSTIDFSDEQIHRAIASLAKFYSALSLAKSIMAQDLPLVPVPDKFTKAIEEAGEGIKKALDDDFNTPEVWAKLFEVTKLFNSLCRTPGKVKPEMKAVAETYFHWMRRQGELMALFQEDADEYLRLLDDMILAKRNLRREEIDQIVKERSQARAEKNFARADEIRQKLSALGIAVMDMADGGSRWETEKG